MNQSTHGQVVSMQPSDNGPLLVRGPVVLVDVEVGDQELQPAGVGAS